MGKLNHWKLCNRLQFADKWYRYKPESVLENESPKIFWDLKYKEITMYVRRSELVFIKQMKELVIK